jgi:cell division protein FtsA
MIEVPSVGGRPPRTLRREVLVNILEPRVEEIFSAVSHVLNESGYREMLHAGVVLTGGSTLLDGLPELAEQILGMQARRASPAGVGGLADVVKSPAYATAVGLVKYGAERVKIARTMPPSSRVRALPKDKRMSSRLGDWFREVF